MKTAAIFGIVMLALAFTLVGCQTQESPIPTPAPVEQRTESSIPPTATAMPPAATPEPTKVPPTETPVAEPAELYLVDKYDASRDAAQDLEEAIAVAQSTGRRIILQVGGDWCPDCAALGKFIENDEEIYNEMARQYLVVKINTSSENTNEEFLSQYPEFEWVPHFFILESDGTLSRSLDTRELMTEAKFDAQKFWDFLNHPQ